MNKDRNSTTGSNANTVVVACLGASITEVKGGASFDWIRELSQRPQNQHFRFCNFGRAGDPAYSALQRLSSVVACRPDKIVIALGWNDIVMYYFKHVRRFLGGWQFHVDGLHLNSRGGMILANLVQAFLDA